jgi:hypothetical protein
MVKLFFLLFLCAGTTAVTFAQADPNDATKTALIENAFKEASEKFSGGGNNMRTSFVSFSSRENTRGSRYLFREWVKGSVTDTANTIYDNKYYFFNYDKISHNLYLTTDKKEVIEIDKNTIRSFTLRDENGIGHTFERIPTIDNSGFCELLVDNSGTYVAYKVVNTHFEKSNYITDGLVETGKNYDEYVDNTQYYIGFKSSGGFRKVELTKKSLRKALGPNPKMDVFFNQHKEDLIDDNYLRGLVDFLNATTIDTNQQHAWWLPAPWRQDGDRILHI